MSNESYDAYDYMFKLIIIGDSGVGKSSILSRYSINLFSTETKSTIGVEFHTRSLKIDEKNIRIAIWDTAGQERFQCATKAFYRKSLGAFLVYDITNRVSFSNITKWLNELKENTDDDLIITLVGNKTDLRHLRAVTIEEAQNLAKNYNLNFIEVSASDSTNIKTAFDDLVKDIYTKITMNQREETLSNNEKPKTVKVTISSNPEQKIKQFNCCN